ncbi:hypothetical protein jhhlp_000659 [Lomentospora prolificans]|uniref:AB hydrolase-1 domain-containing protein n=1 Tax=Lomentospora prolificans TaxID=41688 RepID=A0A2N3NJ48_9PEZI|nr:hypothetical protein jhhlp_000659 [Lomentospora prolificans]
MTIKTSLSADGPRPTTIRAKPVEAYSHISHPPHIGRLKSATGQQATVEPLSIQVDNDGLVPGFLHMPPSFTNPPTTHHRTAAILLSGAGGGLTGPSSIYLSLACKLALLGDGIPTLRLDYRFPAHNKYCVEDVRATMKFLRDMYGLDKFVLVGWSFGSAPVFTVAGADDDYGRRVVGCATVAGQTAEVEGIHRLAPRPVLLLHGTADRTLSPRCSQHLYEMYGDDGDRRIHLFEGDNHTLTQNARDAEEMLSRFIAECAGIKIGEREKTEVIDIKLVEIDEREKLMNEGGDLRQPEHIE